MTILFVRLNAGRASTSAPGSIAPAVTHSDQPDGGGQTTTARTPDIDRAHADDLTTPKMLLKPWVALNRFQLGPRHPDTASKHPGRAAVFTFGGSDLQYDPG